MNKLSDARHIRSTLGRHDSRDVPRAGLQDLIYERRENLSSSDHHETLVLIRLKTPRGGVAEGVDIGNLRSVPAQFCVAETVWSVFTSVSRQPPVEQRRNDALYMFLSVRTELACQIVQFVPAVEIRGESLEPCMDCLSGKDLGAAAGDEAHAAVDRHEVNIFSQFRQAHFEVARGSSGQIGKQELPRYQLQQQQLPLQQHFSHSSPQQEAPTSIIP